MAFRREKFVPRGGPSGGDGGRGGDVLMEASEKHNTLVHFRFNPEYKAQRGRHGEGSDRTGAEGKGIVLKVPVGTIVYDDETGALVHDFSVAGESIVIARGGRGGRGNARFATSTHQAPRECEPGRPGEERVLRLELKLLADVGLVGYPNAGKSTLISRISAARPKIADYPFTTLQPNLGVVALGEEPDLVSFVVADIPGLIEGASHGAGLGMQFLRHVERTRLLVHLIDVSDASGRPDPVKDYEVIMGELKNFGAGLERKPMIVVASKVDAANSEKLAKLRRFAKRKKLSFHEVSAVTGSGIDALEWAMANRVEAVRRASSAPETAGYAVEGLEAVSYPLPRGKRQAEIGGHAVPTQQRQKRPSPGTPEHVEPVRTRAKASRRARSRSKDVSRQEKSAATAAPRPRSETASRRSASKSPAPKRQKRS
jgi:GTP-binding protein